MSKLSLEQRVYALEQLCVVEGCTNEQSQKHHVIPIINSEHDRNEPFNPITNPCLNVCDNHHDMIHGIEKNNMYNLGDAIRKGQQKAKLKGIHIGRKTRLTPKIRQQVKIDRENGLGYKVIASKYSIGVGTVYKCLEPIQNELTYV